MARQRDERGAYALMTGLLAIFLMGIMAVSVDIGNAMARKSDVQGQADFAALAAGSELTGNSGTIPAAVLTAVMDSINENQPVNRNGACVSDTESCIQSTDQLTNGDLTDGEVHWANGGLEVVTPHEQVDYGFAGVLGFESKDVLGRATVRIGSPGSPVPFYATPSCGYGIQTLKDNSGGLSLSVTVPPLYDPAEADTTNPNGKVSDVTPDQIALDATGIEVTVLGTGMTNVTDVGFFNSNKTAPTVVTPTSKTATQVKAIVPASVTAVEDVWYVRVRIAGKWSARLEAASLQIGSAVLQCDPGSTSGNFGTLDLPGWGLNQNSDIAMNIAKGLKPPLSLAKYPDPIPTGLCPLADPRTIYAKTAPYFANTNCADTQPGLRSVAVTPGFLTGVGAEKGKLDKNTSPECTAVGRPNRGTLVGFAPGVNDDLLTCYFTNTTTSIATIASPSYSGDAVLDASIYQSPRFVWVPLLAYDPAGTKTMPIIGFRPGFITDQPTGATRGNNLTTSETTNGLVMKNGSLRAIRVIFFDEDALPSSSPGGALIDYLGVGPRIIQMIN